jgi:hypothetical protein
MFKITSTVGKTTHVFTSEKQFMMQEDWIRANKGQEEVDAWVLRGNTEESMKHPDTIAFYEEWLQDQGITHTLTHEE